MFKSLIDGGSRLKGKYYVHHSFTHNISLFQMNQMITKNSFQKEVEQMDTNNFLEAPKETPNPIEVIELGCSCKLCRLVFYEK